MITVLNCSEGFSVIYYYRVPTGLKSTLNLEGFLEKSLKIKSALKSTGKALKSLEKCLDSTIYCRTLIALLMET